MKKHCVMKIMLRAAPAVLVILFWAASAQSAYVSFNSTAEFSTEFNGSGVWSYGTMSGTTAFSAFSTVEDLSPPFGVPVAVWDRGPGAL